MRISIALALAACCLAGPLSAAEPEAAPADERIAEPTAEPTAEPEAQTGAKTAAKVASQPADPRRAFRDCDGYGEPSGSKDGIGQRPTDVYGLAPGDRNSGGAAERALGDEGVAACTHALADPKLLPAYRVRKSSLLRARAAYQLMRGDHRAAIADLDASEAAGAGADIWYQRSIGLTTRFLRAFAMIKSGDKAGGKALAIRVAEERPYFPYIGLAAAVLRASAGEDWNASVDSLRATARLNPAFVERLFNLALVEGRFADMIALRTQAMPTVPDLSGMNAAERLARIRGANIEDDSKLDGATAYALAATGRQAEADSLIALARARIGMIQPPGPREDGRPPSRRSMDLYKIDQAQAAKGKAALDKWEKMIALRQRVVRREPVNALLEFRALRPTPDGAAADLLEEIGRAQPLRKPQVDAILTVLRASQQMVRESAATLDLRKLYNLLPVAERPDKVAAYDSGSETEFSFDINGFSTRRPSFAGLTTIKFASMESPLAVVDELALLRAADLARRAGKKGFIVVARRAVQRSVYRAGFVSAARAHPEGHTVELDVLFVDPEALPPEFAPAPWRVVDADDVWGRLSGVYARPAGAGK